jgi:hypothetical protein
MEEKGVKPIHFIWNKLRAIFENKLLIFQDNRFVTCQEIFSEGARPA